MLFRSLEYIPGTWKQTPPAKNRGYANHLIAAEKAVFVSLNRYERKKKIDLAIHAFAELPEEVARRSVLVIAGGYDADVRENVEHLCELMALAERLQQSDRIIFRCSISNDERAALMRKATAVLYTPDREHFGIVPIESMFCGTPVVAVASGGPLETILHNHTGFLCEQTPTAFAQAIARFVLEPQLSQQMGAEGKKRVEKLFTNDSFSVALEEQMYQAYSRADAPRVRRFAFRAILAVLLGSVTVALLLYITIHMFVHPQ